MEPRFDKWVQIINNFKNNKFMSLTKTHGFSVSWPFRDCQGCRSYATIKGIQLSCINTLIHLALGGNRFKVSQLKRSQISCKQSVYSSKFSTSVCIVFFLIYFSTSRIYNYPIERYSLPIAQQSSRAQCSWREPISIYNAACTRYSVFQRTSSQRMDLRRSPFAHYKISFI